MLKLSQLLDAKRRDSSDANSDFSSQIRQPQSPLTAGSSTPVSPAVSFFSKGHARYSSSVSSLVSSPGHGNSMESSSRNPLTGVKEEPRVHVGQVRDLEEEYFQHFDQGMSVVEDTYFASVDDYDLTDAGMDIPHSPKKRRSDSFSGKGLSRISSRISTISNRWRSKRVSDGPDGLDLYATGLRSRTSSASSVRPSPAVSRVNSIPIPPSPARTIFEERMSESRTLSIDIPKASSLSQSQEDSAPQATTPLLPPFMGDDTLSLSASRVHSPLQSPSVADITDDCLLSNTPVDSRLAGVPSPPLSSKPSVASFNRPRASTLRTVVGEAPSYMHSGSNDEWANKLGHANFTIQPEPYVPEVYDLESFRQLRDQWDLAQCNFTKHLVRTGEHYGITSNIYMMTEEKWEGVNRKWKQNHEAMLSQLEATAGPLVDIDPCEEVKIPRLHDDKFPELGDGEIVGPMKIAPATGLAGPCQTGSLKRKFFKFFQDLVGRS